MNQQFLFNLYFYIVVCGIAQSLIAWEWGQKGLELLVRKGPGAKIKIAFLLLAIEVGWQRLAKLSFPIDSWEDCWPILLPIAVFFIARRNVPPEVDRIKFFNRAKRLYESYCMGMNLSLAELTDEHRQQASKDLTLAEAERLYKHAISLSKKDGKLYDVAVALYQLGMLLHIRGQYQESSNVLTQALDRIGDLPQDKNLLCCASGCHFHLGHIAELRGDVEEARMRFRRALNIDRELGDEDGEKLCKKALERCGDA